MNITVTKYDPSVDAEPYESTYDVPWYENITALETIMYIHENFEPIAFDYSCHGRACGRCAMMVDSLPGLTCVQPLEDKNHTIEPLAGYPVIRDLIVDKTRAHQDLARRYDRKRVAPIDETEANTFDMSIQEALDGAEWCTRCMSCTAGCPAKIANPKYIGPAAMVAVAYRFMDPYDQADRIIEAVQGGLYECIQCGKCDEACNAEEIRHLELWQMLRDEAEKRGLKPAEA